MYTNYEFGPISRITHNGIYAKKNGEDQERLIFTILEKTPEAPAVPNLDEIYITPSILIASWGGASVIFPRV